MQDKRTMKQLGQQARERLNAQGMSVQAVAKKIGCSRTLVDKVLSGSQLCKSGYSHEVAVFLGMKVGTAKAASYRVTPQREAA
jgi:gp16 family phage-associated protein